MCQSTIIFTFLFNFILRFVRASQTYIFPILLSHDVITPPIFYATFVPIVSWFVAKNVILDPVMKEYKNRKIVKQREINKKRFLKKYFYLNYYNLLYYFFLEWQNYVKKHYLPST